MPPEESNEGDNQEGEEQSFSKSEVERIVGKRLKSHKSEIETLKTQLESRPSADAFSELQEKIEEMQSAKEIENKSGIEQIEHRYNKEVEKRDKKLADMQAQLEAVTQSYSQSQTTLQSERVSGKFGSALNKAKVFPGAMGDALKVLTSELKDVEIGDDGVLRATWGDLIDAEPDQIAAEFLKGRPHLANGTSGGAGTTRSSGGRLPEKLYEKSDEELLRLDAERNRNRY